MSEAGPYPFLPQDYYWYVFERGDDRYRIGWPHIKIEALTSGAPGIHEDVKAALACASKDNRASSADFRSEMERLGFSFIGPSNFDFRSGTRYWQARTLLRLAWQAEQRRLEILAAQHGRAPEAGSLAWPEWWDVSLQAGSCATGARLLGYVSLEAFVNEVLFVNFPAIFDEYEGPESPFHASVPDKLARLLKELGISRRTAWYCLVHSDAGIRRSIEHHKLDPPFTDPAENPDSLGYSPGQSPADVTGFLDAVQMAFDAIHRVFGVELPPTHRPPSPD